MNTARNRQRERLVRARAVQLRLARVAAQRHRQDAQDAAALTLRLARELAGAAVPLEAVNQGGELAAHLALAARLSAATSQMRLREARLHDHALTADSAARLARREHRSAERLAEAARRELDSLIERALTSRAKPRTRAW